MPFNTDRVAVSVTRKGKEKQKTRKGKGKQKMWHAVPLWVVNVAAPNSEPTRLDTSINVTTCGCCDRGQLQLAAGISSNVFVPNDPVDFTLNLDNASKASIQSVKLMLVTEVRWSAMGHTAKGSYKTMATTMVTAVEPNSVVPETRVMATIPSTVLPSVVTDTISVTSHLKVKACTAGDWTKGPSWFVPVRLSGYTLPPVKPATRSHFPLLHALSVQAVPLNLSGCWNLPPDWVSWNHPCARRSPSGMCTMP